MIIAIDDISRGSLQNKLAIRGKAEFSPVEFQQMIAALMREIDIQLM
jgi:hypothetical protein